MLLLTLSVQMSKQSLPKELETLLRLTKPKIDELSYETILKQITSSFNWTYFLERAIATNLAGYLLPYPEIGRQYFPPFVDDQIRGYQRKIQLHSIRLIDLLKDVVELLDSQKIAYAVLKGCAGLIEGKYDYKKRQVSDIDILIDPQAQKKVIALLENEGFRVSSLIYKSQWHESKQNEHAPIQAQKNGLNLDIHIQLFRTNEGYQIATTELLNNSVSIDFNEASYKILPPSAAALFTVLHIHKHLFYGSQMKVGGINDLYPISLHPLKSLAKEWNAARQLEQIDFFWNTWLLEDYNSTFLGKTTLRFLKGRQMTFKEKLIFLKRRLFTNQKQNWDLRAQLYNLFPRKSYLLHYFGKGPYLLIWLKRMRNLFRF